VTRRRFFYKKIATRNTQKEIQIKNKENKE
jgi:hypothetical protein